MIICMSLCDIHRVPGEQVGLVEGSLSSEGVQEELADSLVDHHVGSTSDGSVQLLPQLSVFCGHQPAHMIAD